MLRIALFAPGLLVLPVATQTQRPIVSSAAVVSGPVPFAPLGASAMGVREVMQHMAIPDPASPGRFLCAFTIERLGASNYDIATGTWDPVTQLATIDKLADAINIQQAGSGDDMYQGSLSPDGLAIIADAPGQHPVGSGTAVCAVRASTKQSFTRPVRVSGVPSGYIDPQFCEVEGQLSILFVQGWNLAIGDVSIRNGGLPGMTVTVSNLRTAVLALPGFGQVHSPTPVTDKSGEMHAILCSAVRAGSSATPVYHPGTEAGDLTAGLLGPAVPGWLANPMSIPQQGTAYYADVTSRLRPSKRIEYFATSGDIVGAAGGKVALHTVCPPSMSGDLLFLNFGTMAPFAGLGTAGLGLIAVGDLSLNIQVSLSAGSISGTDHLLSFSIPAGAIPLGVVIDGQAIAMNLRTGQIVAGNNFAIE